MNLRQRVALIVSPLRGFSFQCAPFQGLTALAIDFRPVGPAWLLTFRPLGLCHGDASSTLVATYLEVNHDPDIAAEQPAQAGTTYVSPNGAAVNSQAA